MAANQDTGATGCSVGPNPGIMPQRIAAHKGTFRGRPVVLPDEIQLYGQGAPDLVWTKWIAGEKIQIQGANQAHVTSYCEDWQPRSWIFSRKIQVHDWIRGSFV